ncbi:MAG: hypothetical protein B0W54_00115 [Cellvibrio sp. 79]|nr:MAG: hypothetical protein B0W54_00115 [Cellvibrio sp. 79]
MILIFDTEKVATAAFFYWLPSHSERPLSYLMCDANWCVELNLNRFLHQLDNVVIELFTPILLSLATIESADFDCHGFHPLPPLPM